MKKQKMQKKDLILPNSAELEAELARVRRQKTYRWTLRSTIYLLITVAAIAVLTATLWLPVLRIYGDSMTPTMTNGDIVVTVKTDDLQTGDIIAFYYNNKILVKRVIATSGDWVEMSDDGTVSVNGEMLEEPYLQEKAYGDCNLAFPYQVPESRVFVMGDHRSVSVDSRNMAIGCIAEEQIVGKLMIRIWPLTELDVF